MGDNLISSTVANLEKPAPDSPEVRRYNRIRRRLGIADFLLGLALLVVLLATGWTARLRDLAYLGAGQIYVLAVFFYVFMLTVLNKVLGLGLDYYAFRVEHQFNLSNQKLSSWAKDQVKGWLVGLVIGSILVELVYWTIRAAPRFWWLIAWAIFIILYVFFAQIAPVVLFPLFYKFKPLENDGLKERLTRLSERAGTRVKGVYEWKLSEKSRKANAALAGLGVTRRIILADTLLEKYTDDEIEAILAHELGHHVHRHIPKSILVEAGITFFGFWAANQILHYAMERRHLFEQLSDFANLPLLMLVSAVLSLLLMPALNAYSRFNERQADRYSYTAIPSIAPFVSGMNKLADQNLAERQPSRLVELLFHSHPPIAKRVQAAEAWARAQESGVRSQSPA
ncbi:MAG TPA: M48 family metallopeptidase [Terriglobales bacterium]|nr:M48 family metallopeptidase [Terriglobales bacterium]